MNCAKFNIEEVLNWSTKECYDQVAFFLCYWVEELGVEAEYGSINKDYLFCDFGYQLPIMLVAHMDTVDDDVSRTSVLSLTKDIKIEHGVVTNSGGGVLGADDRAGVYAILHILEDRITRGLPLPSVLFTTGEERGGIGVGEFCKTNLLDASKINLMIELDRQGNDDYVSYHKLPKKVCKYVETFGWYPSHGIYSDIQDLTEKYKVPSINVSIGYYSQHTSREFLVLNEMLTSIERVQKMLDKPFQEKLEVDIKINPYWGYYNRYQPYDEMKEEIDLCVDELADNKVCPLCNTSWWNCLSECGYMVDVLKEELDCEQLEYLLDNYLFEDDVIYQALYDFVEEHDDESV